MCAREMIPKWTLALSILAALLHGKKKNTNWKCLCACVCSFSGKSTSGVFPKDYYRKEVKEEEKHIYYYNDNNNANKYWYLSI